MIHETAYSEWVCIIIDRKIHKDKKDKSDKILIICVIINYFLSLLSFLSLCILLYFDVNYDAAALLWPVEFIRFGGGAAEGDDLVHSVGCGGLDVS